MAKLMRLGDLLVDSGTITAEQLNDALEEQKSTGLRLGETLVKRGVLTEGKLLDALSSHLNLQIYSLSRYRPMPEALRMIPENVARRLHVIPSRWRRATPSWWQCQTLWTSSPRTKSECSPEWT